MIKISTLILTSIVGLASSHESGNSNKKAKDSNQQAAKMVNIVALLLREFKFDGNTPAMKSPNLTTQ